MARGNPNIRNILHKGRKPVTDEPFYFILNERYRVTKDTYNFIINERYNTSEVGKLFFGTLPTLIQWGLSNIEVSQGVIDKFVKMVQGVSSSFKDEKLVVKVPNFIQYDKRDVLINKEKSVYGEV